MLKKYTIIFLLLKITSCKSIDLNSELEQKNYFQIKTSTQTTLYLNQNTSSLIIEKLKKNTYVTLLNSSANHLYEKEFVGKWIQVKTENDQIGWAISHNFDMEAGNLDSIENKNCNIEINKGCYFNRRSSRLCREPELECNQINLGWIYYSEYFLVRKISTDRKWVYGIVNNDIDQKGWIKINTLVEENQLDLIDSVKNEPYIRPYNSYHLETHVNTFNSTSNITLKNIDFNETYTFKYGIRFYVKGVFKENKNLVYGFAVFHENGRTLKSYVFLQKQSLSTINDFKDCLINKFNEISKLISTEYILLNKFSKSCYYNGTYRFSLYSDLSLRYRASHETSQLDLNSIKKNGDRYILKATDYSSYLSDESIFKLHIKSSNQIYINNELYIPIENHKGGKCANYFAED